MKPGSRGFHTQLLTPNSAAADRDNDLQAVAAGKRGLGMPAARDDLAVLLDGDALARQVELLDQPGDSERSGEGTGFAVDDQFNHNFYPAGLFSRIGDSTPKAPRTRRASGAARASYSGIT